MIAAVPAATPDTTPVEDVTAATLLLPLVHVPPPTELLNVVVLPAHTLVVPVMEDGTPLTVRTTTLMQPLPEL